jgi:hypothetical protein
LFLKQQLSTSFNQTYKNDGSHKPLIRPLLMQSPPSPVNGRRKKLIVCPSQYSRNRAQVMAKISELEEEWLSATAELEEAKVA